MKWGILIGVTVIMALIIWYEWPKMKQNPKKDKAVFLVLLAIGWTLSLFDLPNMAGPTTLLDAVFRPVSKLMGIE